MSTTQYLRCVDNTLYRDKLTVGQVYEVHKVDDRYGDVHLAGFDTPFSLSRFVPAQPDEEAA